MLKENWRFVSRIERLADSIIIIGSFFLAYYGRSSLLYWNELFNLHIPFEGPALAPVKDYFIVLLVALAGYITALNLLGAYSSMRLSSSFRILRVSLLSSIIVFFMLAAVLFLLKIDLSRAFILLFCGFCTLALTAERFLVIRLLRFWRRRGWNFRNIIISGIGEQAVRLTREINARPELGIRIRGFADLHEEDPEGSAILEHFKADVRAAGYDKPVKIIRGGENLGKALREYAIDEIIFTDVVDVMPEVEELVLVCSEQGVRTTIAADLFSVGLVKSGMSYFGGMPLIHFQTPPGDRWELAVKRAMDIAVSCILLLLLSPLFALIALAVKATSKGDTLFMQRRVGLNGRLFNMYKFRSMFADAEEQFASLKALNEMKGPAFKMKKDPRVTALGRFLRRHSLDELPQLWNVLIGDMSLVGPRPPVPGEVSMYERKDRRRLSMRPGLTCIWQVSGRNTIPDFDEWVKLDLEYIDNWSLGRDFLLLFRTIPAVLRGQGAS